MEKTWLININKTVLNICRHSFHISKIFKKYSVIFFFNFKYVRLKLLNNYQVAGKSSTVNIRREKSNCLYVSFYSMCMWKVGRDHFETAELWTWRKITKISWIQRKTKRKNGKGGEGSNCIIWKGRLYKVHRSSAQT